jgi:glycosyltransferase involved in cell wall biosynthesis
MPFFSVIVPIYNAEKSLRKCLDSLAAQTETDFEILMVENGSMDGSNAICREYAGRDRRFVLIEMPTNSGPSGARNAGLDQAKGDWAAFVDSDDSVEPEFLECIRDASHNADTVFFGYRQYSLTGAFLGEQIPSCTQPDGPALWAELHRQGLFGYTWIKAFRRDAIGSQRFSRDLDLMEDEVFACQVLARGCRTAVLAKPLYNYVTGDPGSLMGRTHPDYCRKADAAYRAWKQILTNPTELAELANLHVSRCMYYGFERDVEPAAFFRELTETDFFRDCTLDDKFCCLLRARQFARVRLLRRAYRLKQAAARLLKK